MATQRRGLKPQESRKEYFERLIAWAVDVVHTAENEVTVNAVIEQISGKKNHVREAIRLRLVRALDGSDDESHLRRPLKIAPIVSGLLDLGPFADDDDLARLSPRLMELSSRTRSDLIDALVSYQQVPEPNSAAFGQVGDAIAALERLDGDPDVKYDMTMGRFAAVAEALERETRARMATKRQRAQDQGS